MRSREWEGGERELVRETGREERFRKREGDGENGGEGAEA